MRLVAISILTAIGVAACTPAAPPPAPTAAPTTAAAKPAVASPVAAKPAAASPATKPVASPAAAASPGASPAAKPAAKPSFDEAAVASFYRGKTVTIVVGYSAGGGYDEYARFLGRHITRHIPGNPNVIVQNQPGAGSVLAANTLFNSSPKDGTVFGTFARGLPASELLGEEGVQYKSAQFNWIGSMNDEVSVCVARSDSPIKKFDDMYTTPMKIGGTGPAADTDFFPRFLNGLLGTKFDIAAGYPGGNDINVAMERGEVQGRCGWSYSSVIVTRPDWIQNKFITILVQMSLNKHPGLPNVPLVTDLARNEEERQLMRIVFSRQTMGRPFAAPPGVPADRVSALRYAFDQTMKDPQFLAETKQAKMEINPASGADLQTIVQDVLASPPELAKKLAALTKE